MFERPADSRTARPPGAAEAAHPPDPTAALERIRAMIHRRLDRIEAIARESIALGSDHDGEPGRLLQELQAREAALEAEANQRAQEWERRVEAIEHDRRLLGEAWERLERERLAVADPPSARASHATAPADQDAPPPPRVARPAGGGDDAIDQSILRQFEALRQDVRRRAETHQATRTDR